MRLQILFLTLCAMLTLNACATPGELPLYGNYENIDNQSICMGMLAFSADFPQAIWPGKSKAFYSDKKNTLVIQSTALFKIAIKKYGKQDASERGITGYSSAKSLAYVLGGGAVREALNRCEPTVAQALKVDGSYQDFLNHLGTVDTPAISEIVPQEVPTSTTLGGNTKNNINKSTIPQKKVLIQSKPAKGKVVNGVLVPDGMRLVKLSNGSYALTKNTITFEPTTYDVKPNAPLSKFNIK